MLGLIGGSSVAACSSGAANGGDRPASSKDGGGGNSVVGAGADDCTAAEDGGPSGIKAGAQPAGGGGRSTVIGVNAGGAAGYGGSAGTYLGTHGEGGSPILLTIDTDGGVSSVEEAHFCVTRKFPTTTTCQGTPGYWGEAVQKALWFLNVNRSGPGVECTRVQWRGDAHLSDGHIKLSATDPNGVSMSAAYIDKYRKALDPDGNGEVDLSGGFYDAGDFVKFGLTSSYTAATLAWSMYEYPEVYRTLGLQGEAFDILRWLTDYFMRSTFFENAAAAPDQWNVIAFAHQVSDGTDHTCGWMPPELRRPNKCPRKAYFATHEKPAADVTASAAAALTLASLVIRPADATYADRCLDYAKALYRYAEQYPSSKSSDDGGLYVSEYSTDDLAWAAAWLYVATQDRKYVEDSVGASKNAWLNNMGGLAVSCLANADANCWTESQTYSWNSVRSGVFLKFAQILKDIGHPYASAVRNIARIDSTAWLTSAKTPGGLSLKAWNAWGSGRYNSAGQFVALVYAKAFPDDQDAAAFGPWAKSQAEYLLGKNPLNKSYMMGFTDHYANQPHHAAGHASIYGEPDIPTENRHILWGALVNGPATQKDEHVDHRADYGSNEVTIDYNASFLAALVANYAQNGAGQCPLPAFPPLEPPADEFYTRARINSDNSCRSQIEITAINESVWPPRFDTHLSARYYIDVTELLDAQISLDLMKASMIYDRGQLEFGDPTKLKGPTACETNGNMYYFELSYEGSEFWGEQVRLTGPRVSIVDFGLPDGPNCTWKPNNDWSHQGLTKDSVKSPHVTMYSSGKLVWGEEPPCHPVKKKVVPAPIPVVK